MAFKLPPNEARGRRTGSAVKLQREFISSWHRFRTLHHLGWCFSFFLFFLFFAVLLEEGGIVMSVVGGFRVLECWEKLTSSDIEPVNGSGQMSRGRVKRLIIPPHPTPLHPHPNQTAVHPLVNGPIKSSVANKSQNKTSPAPTCCASSFWEKESESGTTGKWKIGEFVSWFWGRCFHWERT